MAVELIVNNRIPYSCVPALVYGYDCEDGVQIDDPDMSVTSTKILLPSVGADNQLIRFSTNVPTLRFGIMAPLGP